MTNGCIRALRYALMGLTLCASAQAAFADAYGPPQHNEEEPP